MKTRSVSRLAGVLLPAISMLLLTAEPAHANRYYSPEQGRFISRDPVGDETVDEQMNLYEYAGSRSTYGVDPLGSWTIIPGPLLPACKTGSSCEPTGTAQYPLGARQTAQDFKVEWGPEVFKWVTVLTRRRGRGAKLAAKQVMLKMYHGYKCICICKAYVIKRCCSAPLFCTDRSKLEEVARPRAYRMGPSNLYFLSQKPAEENKCKATCAAWFCPML